MPVKRGHFAPKNVYLDTIIRKFEGKSKFVATRLGAGNAYFLPAARLTANTAHSAAATRLLRLRFPPRVLARYQTTRAHVRHESRAADGFDSAAIIQHVCVCRMKFHYLSPAPHAFKRQTLTLTSALCTLTFAASVGLRLTFPGRFVRRWRTHVCAVVAFRGSLFGGLRFKRLARLF